MKKIYGFLGAVALLMMASCSSESGLEGGPDGALQNPEKKGDLFMSMSINPVGTIGSRTATPNQTSEVGKDRENTISKALVIFAEPEGDSYKVVTSVFAGTVADTEILPSADDAKYMATFAMDRQTLLDDIGEGNTKTYNIFVVVNATTDLAAKFTKDADVQQVFETAGDEATYWQVNNFLMTNSELSDTKIAYDEIQPGTYTTKANALSLGTVKVQRAMSRFDLATAARYTVFTADEEVVDEQGTEIVNSAIKNLTIKFDAVAMINMAQTAYSFKVTGVEAATAPTFGFAAETATNWVYTPAQTNWSAPLFTVATGATQSGSAVELASLFETAAPETNGAVGRVGGYTLLSSLAEDDNAYERPSDASTDQPAYMIWRYCMENTNPTDINNQLNGNSTGVVFRAEITGTKVDGTELTAEDGAVYAYDNVILGGAEALKAYAEAAKSEKDETTVYDAVKMRYAQAKKDAAEKDDWDAETGELAALDKYLVEQGFSIYRPTNGKYYCYYIYWNRHNDNGKNTVMGTMEFATVRNNVYKLRVTKINKLGHPSIPGDDPDEPTGDTPDEKDEFYCTVECEILPWEVRVNDIEF